MLNTTSYLLSYFRLPLGGYCIRSHHVEQANSSCSNMVRGHALSKVEYMLWGNPLRGTLIMWSIHQHIHRDVYFNLWIIRFHCLFNWWSSITFEQYNSQYLHIAIWNKSNLINPTILQLTCWWNLMSIKLIFKNNRKILIHSFMKIHINQFIKILHRT